MFKNIITRFVNFCLMVFIVIVLISIGAVTSRFQGMLILDMKVPVREPSILQLDLEGVIIDGKDFLSDLKKYRDDKNVKGVLIHVNSPGGVVGPSQEIYSEILKVREELQKPVVVSSGAIVASGAYYAAVAADQIITNPGTLMGSIGVIMEFANLEELYDWAKIKRYTIKTGSLKDAGSDHRAMTQEEREYFQSVLDRVQVQFESAVEKNRKLDKYVIDKYADGQIFTGETAVKMGFADQVGTHSDALRIVGELAGLGASPEVFTPPKRSKNNEILELLLNGTFSVKSESLEHPLKTLKLLGQPLYMMPGALGL